MRDDQNQESSRGTVSRWTSVRTALLLFVVSLVASMAVFYRIWFGDGVRTLAGPDPVQTIWFLKWVPWQLVHGHDPFRTDVLYYPAGVSLAWNTLTPTLGLAAAPITFTLGPVWSFKILMTLAAPLTAVTSFCWLRRHVRHPAAGVGALLIAFGPYTSGHMLGHLNLTFIALEPVMLMLAEDLLWRHPRSARRTGVLLGAVTAAQAGISEELIIIIALGVAIAVVAYAGRDRMQWANLGSVVPGLVIAVAVFLSLASPLLISQLFLSPAVHVSGSAWHATLGDYLIPKGRQLLDFHLDAMSLQLQDTTIVNAAEDGVYLGPIMLVVVIAGFIATRRQKQVRVAAITLIAATVITFGGAGPFKIPLPWAIGEHLPVLSSVLPIRFSLVSLLVIAWLIVRWLDEAMASLRHRDTVSPWRSRVTLSGCLVAVATLVPSSVGVWQYLEAAPYYTSASFRQTFLVGTPLLVLPVAMPLDDHAMYAQAEANFRFKQPGGYALNASGPHGKTVYGPPDSALVRLNQQAVTLTAAGEQNGASEDYSATDLTLGRRQLNDQGYRAIIVDDQPANEAFRLLATALAGNTAPEHTQGVYLWRLSQP